VDRTINLSITIGKRTGRLIVAGLLVLALVVPGTALAGHLFDDVPNGHTFHSSINNVYERGLTVGCGGGDYCPDNAVTRGQMSAFLDRIFKADGLPLGYANITAEGTVESGYARNLGPVTLVAEGLAGYYKVSFGGLTITDDHVIIVQPRQTFGNEVCRVSQGTSGTTAEVFCHTIAAGSPAINIDFSIVVYNDDE
jgi:hypothetical protein